MLSGEIDHRFASPAAGKIKLQLWNSRDHRHYPHDLTDMVKRNDVLKDERLWMLVVRQSLFLITAKDRETYVPGEIAKLFGADTEARNLIKSRRSIGGITIEDQCHPERNAVLPGATLTAWQVHQILSLADEKTVGKVSLAFTQSPGIGLELWGQLDFLDPADSRKLPLCRNFNHIEHPFNRNQIQGVRFAPQVDWLPFLAELDHDLVSEACK